MGAIAVNSFASLWNRVAELNRRGRPRIGVGLERSDAQVIGSLERARPFSEVLIVCSPNVSVPPGFATVTDDQPEARLAQLLVDGEVEGILRGTLDSRAALRAYLSRTGETNTICPALVEDPSGRQFYVCPVSNPDGWTKEQRLSEARQTARLMQDWDVKPSIAVYTGIRRETYEGSRNDAQGVTQALVATYDDAEEIVEQLNAAGFSAKNMQISLNTAVADGYNLHIPVNGMVGNQIFRVLLMCGGRILTMTRIGLSRPYEDSARSEVDMEPHIRWLAAVINKRSRSSTEG